MVQKYKIPLKVHFSMHNPLDEKRFTLLPSTKVNVLEALENLYAYSSLIKNDKTIMAKYPYCHRTNDVVEIHYTLIKNVNDSMEELKRLVSLLKKYPMTIKFIRFNPLKKLEISNNEELWIATLKKELPNVRVKTYCPPGKEIGSSCGEFTKHYYHMEIESQKEKEEFEEWKKIHQVEIN